jgi:hypothetical protein
MKLPVGAHDSNTSPPFTPEAKAALRFAREEALHRSDVAVGPEHVLLGVLRAEDYAALTLLTSLGVVFIDLRDQVLLLMQQNSTYDKWNQLPWNVEIEQFGRAVETRSLARAADVVALCHDFEHERDVTLVVYRVSSRERLLLGFDQDFAFLALDGPSGLYQFKPPAADPAAPLSFEVGGQGTSLVTHYLLPAALSAEIVRRWLSGDDELSEFGAWERK